MTNNKGFSLRPRRAGKNEVVPPTEGRGTQPCICFARSEEQIGLLLSRSLTNKIILGFVGDLSAGKGTICQYLKDKYGVNSYRFSTMLRDILHRIYVKESRENLQTLSTFLRVNYGQDIMSNVIAKDVENDPREIVAVEGIRRPTDITYLNKMDNFHLIYVTAAPEIRWQRMVKRNENRGDSEKTLESFLKDEQAEADTLIKGLGKEAEFTITNDGTFEELYQKVEQIISKIKNESKN